jgi:hypothetical protein
MGSSASRLGQAVMATRSETPVRVAVGALFLLDAVFVALFLLMQATGGEIDTLSVAAERSVPTWYASVKLFLVGQALLATAFLLPFSARTARLALVGLAVLFAVLSVDEIASLHERFGWRLNAWLAGEGGSQADLVFARTGYWMVALLPLTLGALAFLGHAYWRASRPGWSVAGKALLGCGLLLGGAAGVEALQNFLPDGAVLGVAIALEEGFELAGVTFLLWAALVELARHAGAGWAWGLSGRP